MEILTLLFFLASSIFARVIESGKFYTLTSEVGQHYLEMIKLLEGQILLQGPLTSHPWIRLSATPYYLFFPVFTLFNYHPLTLTYLTTIVSIITPIINYFVVKKVFDKKTAIVSTIFLAFSPLALTSLRVPGFYSFVPALAYWLILLVHNILADKSKNIWPVFLISGLMSTLHSASFMLFPFFVIVFYILKKLKFNQVIYGSLAFIIPNIPYLVNDAYKGFSMTKSFLLWIPYKLINFLTGKTLGLGRLPTEDTTIKEVLAFLRADVLPPQTHWALGTIVLLTIIYYFFVKKRSVFERVLYFWMLFGLFVLIIHKNPPSHYFVTIFFLPLILFSKALASITKDGAKKYLLAIVVLGTVIVNLRFIFSNAYLYNDPNRSLEFVSYKDQMRIVKTLVKDAKEQKYSLTRIGPFDKYANEFKENYEFLLWREGNRPVKDAKVKYVIVEGKFKKGKQLDLIAQSGKITLYRINSQQSK